MKFKGIFLVLFLSFQTFVFSQTKTIDFKRIKKQIKKKRSDFYYLDLVKKYTRGLPMSLDEKRYFYYGFAFFESYKPFEGAVYYNKINQIITGKKYTKKNLKLLLNYVNMELAKHPFNLKLLNIKSFVYKRLKDSVNYHIVKKQIQVIQDAIMSSGNGLTLSNPYVVIYVSNEYDVLNLLGLNDAGKKIINKNLEYIKVKENAKKIKGLYFDVQLIGRRINTKKK